MFGCKVDAGTLTVSCLGAEEGNRKPLKQLHHIPSPVFNNDSHCCTLLSVHLALFIFVHTGIIQMRKTCIEVSESGGILYAFKASPNKVDMAC